MFCIRSAGFFQIEKSVLCGKVPRGLGAVWPEASLQHWLWSPQKARQGCINKRLQDYYYRSLGFHTGLTGQWSQARFSRMEFLVRCSVLSSSPTCGRSNIVFRVWVWIRIVLRARRAHFGHLRIAASRLLRRGSGWFPLPCSLGSMLLLTFQVSRLCSEEPDGSLRIVFIFCPSHGNLISGISRHLAENLLCERKEMI